MNPTPDSVIMTINSTIKLPIILPVRIDAFPMSLLMRDLPGNSTYAKVYIPNSLIQVKGSLGEVNHPTPLNLPIWRQFVRNVLFQDTVMLSTHGRTEQHLGELHSMVTVNKDVPLNGTHPGPSRCPGLTLQASATSKASPSSTARSSPRRTRTGQTSWPKHVSPTRVHLSWRSYVPSVSVLRPS